MSKQTKLTAQQKLERKELLAYFLENQGMIYSSEENGITVAVLPHFPGSRFVKLSVAYMAMDEKKFRVKVGEFLAMRRLIDGEYICIPACDEANIVDAIFGA